MSQSDNEQLPAPQVESVDFSEQSIDEQLVQLAQAKLDGQIDQTTYEKLVALVRESQPTYQWDSSTPLQYPRNTHKGPSGLTVLGITFKAVCLLFLFGVLLEVFAGISATSRTTTMRMNRVNAELTNLKTALDAFEIDTGRYPKPSEGLDGLVVAPPGLAAWRGPYIRFVPNDPWQRPYMYIVPGKRHPNSFDLSSAGPDGTVGTTDDISN